MATIHAKSWLQTRIRRIGHHPVCRLPVCLGTLPQQVLAPKRTLEMDEGRFLAAGKHVGSRSERLEGGRTPRHDNSFRWMTMIFL